MIFGVAISFISGILFVLALDNPESRFGYMLMSICLFVIAWAISTGHVV